MKDSTYYLELVADHDRHHGGTGSDYAVAKSLNISRARVSKYRNGKSEMGDSLAIRIARRLNLPACEVLANIHAARCADEEVRCVWQQIARDAATAA